MSLIVRDPKRPGVSVIVHPGQRFVAAALLIFVGIVFACGGWSLRHDSIAGLLQLMALGSAVVTWGLRVAWRTVQLLGEGERAFWSDRHH